MLLFLIHCNLTNMQVCLNHSRCPTADMATDFVKEQYVGVYKSFYDFASRHYGIDNLLAGSQVRPAAYKGLYPIHVFDVSKQSERLVEGVLDLTEKWNLVRMYPQIHKPTPGLSVIEWLNLKATDQRGESYSRWNGRSRWST